MVLSMTNPDDVDLVRRSLAGDREAFGALIDRYERLVFNLAYRLTGNREEAEDVAQNVFLKAYEKLQSYDFRFKFFSWLYRITHNEAVNALQRGKRMQGLDEEMEADGSPFPDGSLDALLQEGLMELQEGHRTLIVLKHVQGLSYDEIAGILQIPEKKVKSRLFTARELLREILTKKGVTPDDY